MSAPSPQGLVWLLMLGVAVVGSNSLALSPILSDVAADLRASPVEVARANAAYGGATALAALTLGGLVVWVVADTRLQKRRLARLEAEGYRRPSRPSA